MSVSTMRDLLDAERAFARVQPELEALRIDELAAMNVDVVSAASIVLGVAARVQGFRERMARLPELTCGSWMGWSIMRWRLGTPT